MKTTFKPDPGHTCVYLKDGGMVIEFQNLAGDVYVLDLDPYTYGVIVEEVFADHQNEDELDAFIEEPGKFNIPF